MTVGLDINTFKALVVNGKTPKSASLTKAALPGDVEAIPDSRKAVFVISTSSVDRDQDAIDVKGWQLDNYNRNPIVLFGHNQNGLPIGRAKVFEEAGCLKAEVEFADASVNPLAENVYQGVIKGFIHATSVGFRPIDFEISDDADRHSKSGRLPPVDFRSVELLELSIVTVPANPEAIIEMPADGIFEAGPKGFDPVKRAKRQRMLAMLELAD